MSITIASGIVVIVVVVLLVLAIFFYKKLKQSEQGYPKEEEIEQYVLPYIYEAIFAGYKTSEYVLEKFGKSMDGMDKKAVAKTLYELLPKTISIRGFEVEIKNIISPEEFEDSIQIIFGEFSEFYWLHVEHFLKAVEEQISE